MGNVALEKWSTKNHASRIQKAAAAIYGKRLSLTNIHLHFDHSTFGTIPRGALEPPNWRTKKDAPHPPRVLFL